MNDVRKGSGQDRWSKKNKIVYTSVPPLMQNFAIGENYHASSLTGAQYQGFRKHDYSSIVFFCFAYPKISTIIKKLNAVECLRQRNGPIIREIYSCCRGRYHL